MSVYQNAVSAYNYELERRRAEVERHRQNRARLAQEFHKFQSVGQGFIEFDKVAAFDITMIEEPYVSYGATLDLDALAEQQNLDPGVDPAIPLTTGVVTEWDRDDRGFYVGAWVAVRVYFPPTDAIPADMDVEILHWFTFTAIGIKDVPVDVRD